MAGASDMKIPKEGRRNNIAMHLKYWNPAPFTVVMK